MKIKTFRYAIAYKAYADDAKNDALAIFELSSKFIKWVEQVTKLFNQVREIHADLSELSFYSDKIRLYSWHELISEVWDLTGDTGGEWLKSLLVDEDNLLNMGGERVHISDSGVWWSLFDDNIQYATDCISIQNLRKFISPVQMLIENARG